MKVLAIVATIAVLPIAALLYVLAGAGAVHAIREERRKDQG